MAALRVSCKLYFLFLTQLDRIDTPQWFLNIWTRTTVLGLERFTLWIGPTISTIMSMTVIRSRVSFKRDSKVTLNSVGWSLLKWIPTSLVTSVLISSILAMQTVWMGRSLWANLMDLISRPRIKSNSFSTSETTSTSFLTLIKIIHWRFFVSSARKGFSFLSLIPSTSNLICSSKLLPSASLSSSFTSSRFNDSYAY